VNQPVVMFEEENKAFESRKEELLRLCEGKFALFKGSDFGGVYDTPQSAYSAGIEKYGNVEFLIKPISKQPVVEHIPTLFIGSIGAHS